METIYILLGSNLGNSLEILAQTRARIKDIAQIVSFSSVYQTKAWGDIVQDDFLNQVIQLESNYDPHILLKKFKSIEAELGRTKTIKWGPRILDMDILFVGKKTINSHDLVIPHPRIQERRFVLEPLCEIAPDFIHPVFSLSIRELLRQCPDTLPVNKISTK